MFQIKWQRKEYKVYKDKMNIKLPPKPQHVKSKYNRDFRLAFKVGEGHLRGEDKSLSKCLIY